MADKPTKKETNETKETPKPTCGIVMPISEIDGCPMEHWLEVKQILMDVIDSIGFIGNLVSDAEEISIIQKTIVQNIYNNDIVVCDVSGKNPNVMFELGLRLAFDKATIIIKDNVTDYSFDTSPIEHLTYPRDLRFHKIVEFKEKLKNKIKATFDKSKADANYSTFLKSFGEFKIAHLESKEVSSDVFIMEYLKELRNDVKRLERANTVNKPDKSNNNNLIDELRLFFLKTPPREEIEKAEIAISQSLYTKYRTYEKELSDGKFELYIHFLQPLSKSKLNDLMRHLEYSLSDEFAYGFKVND